jgi:outer membrane murein-binding lipoprotein Lpp
MAAGLVGLAAVAGLAGCASRADIDALRKEIHEVSMTASRAREEALAASQMAGEAKSTADKVKARVDVIDAGLERRPK